MKKLLLAAACLFLVPFSVQAELLFEPGDVVVLTEEGKSIQPGFWKGPDGEPVTEAKVLEEDNNGLVTVYDKLTKDNKQIAREFIKLKEPRSEDEAELPGSVGDYHFGTPDEDVPEMKTYDSLKYSPNEPTDPGDRQILLDSLEGHDS